MSTQKRVQSPTTTEQGRLQRRLLGAERNLDRLNRGVGGREHGFRTTLPTDGAAGDFVTLTDTVSGTPVYSWRFMFNEATASIYPWQFIGGPAHHNIVTTTVTGMVNTGYSVQGSPPAFTTPAAGVYDILHGFASHSSGAWSQYTYQIPSVNGTEVGNDTHVYSLSGHGWEYGTGLAEAVTVGTAGHVINVENKVGGNSMNISSRWIIVTPRRVG